MVRMTCRGVLQYAPTNPHPTPLNPTYENLCVMGNGAKRSEAICACRIRRRSIGIDCFSRARKSIWRSIAMTTFRGDDALLGIGADKEIGATGWNRRPSTQPMAAQSNFWLTRRGERPVGAYGAYDL